jgi:hypothetical protein
MVTTAICLVALSASPGLVFTPAAAQGHFAFDTGAISGVLRADGRSHGIVELREADGGATFVRPGYPGIFSLYRLFSGGRRFPDARTAPHTAAIIEDGAAVCITWEPKDDRPFLLTATYRLPDPRSVRLVIGCRAAKPLPSCEVFLSSYVTGEMRHFLFVKKTLHQGGSPAPVLLEPTATPFTDGCYFAFPRDEASCRPFFDGRWQQPKHPVHWAIGRHYALPILGTRDPRTGRTLLIFAQQEDCFGLETTYHRPGKPDSVADHNSLYLSLGGRDLQPGQSVSFTVEAKVLGLPRPEESIPIFEQWVKTAR